MLFQTQIKVLLIELFFQNMIKLKVNINSIIKSIIILTCFAFQNINAQEVLERITINPMNRVNIYFNEIPKFTSSLSADKQKITIKIPVSSFKNNISELSGKGVVQKVTTNKVGNDIEIEIFSGEKRGYNATPMPFSNSIQVELFKWDKLTPAEDAFHTALLALESKVTNEGINNLNKAIKLGDINAAGMLGVLQMQDGNTKEAFDNLSIAERSNSNYPDVYGALSKYYKLKGNVEKANYYLKVFKEKTGLNNVKDASEDLKNNALSDEPKSQLQSLMSDEAKDTSKQKTENKAILSPKDSALSKSLLGATNKDSSRGFFPDFSFDKIIPMLGYGLFGVSLLVIYLYLTWRKKQMERLDALNLSTKKSSDPLSPGNIKQTVRIKRPKTAPPTPANPQRAGSIIDKTYGKLRPTKDNQYTKENLAISPKPQEVQSNIVEDTPNLQIEEFLRNYLPIKAQEEKEAEEAAKLPENLIKKILGRNKDLDIKRPKEVPQEKPIEEVKVVDTNKDAKVSFAMHLAEKQNEIKQQDIESLSTIELNSTDDLDKLSQRLGIEKEGIETKRNLENLDEDNSLINRLSEKFKTKK